MTVAGDVWESVRTWPIFVFFVLVTVAFAAVVGLITFDVIDLGMTHFGLREHRIHDLTFGLLFMTGVAGLLAQGRRPLRHTAGMVMALLPWAGLFLAALLSADVFRVLVINPSIPVAALTVVSALLHPAGRDFFRSFRLARVSWTMLTLVGIAAVPLLALVVTNAGLQASVPDDHAAMGHYGFMAAWGLTVIGVGVVASMRPDGWMLTAWVAGLLPAVLGAASLISPVASGLSRPWALAAIVWGCGFVMAAVSGRRAD